MREYNISYKNMILQCETDDAYTDYDFHKDLYIIYYNDIDVTKTKSNRYRWNIAHELGHIVLDHNLNSENTKLFRNKLDDYEYTILEKEADSFASYILAPYLPLFFLGIRTTIDMKNMCKISSPAAKYRFSEYVKWLKSTKNINPKNNLFEYSLWELFFQTVKCKRCNQIFIGKKEYKYCKICGNPQIFFYWRNEKMTYSKIELNENQKPLECPRCKNEHLPSDGEYCQICGGHIYNNCTNVNSGYNNCEHGERLDGDARYCPYCGSPTTYYLDKLLKDYKEEFEQPSNNHILTTKKVTNEDDNNDDYPF